MKSNTVMINTPCNNIKIH